MGKAERHKRDWAPTKTQSVIDARALAVYTNHIISNKNVFKPEYDWNGSTLSLINITARTVYLKAWSADKTNAKVNKTMYEEKMKLWAQAIRTCGELLALIELSWPQFHIAAKKIYHWSKMTMNVEDKLLEQYQLDEENYSKLYE